jgi:hypothetical protein
MAERKYRALLTAKPSNRAQLEKVLGGLVWLGARPSSTSWARFRKLKADESVVRYFVLGIEPIDVVVTADGEVVAIYPSFE